MDTARSYNVLCGRDIKNKKAASCFSQLKSKIFSSIINNDQKIKKCNLDNLCVDCITRRGLLYNDYHLYDRPMLLVRVTKYYFKNLPGNVIREAVNIGSMDVERIMRDNYENLYIQTPDSGHNYFKFIIPAKSPLSGFYKDYSLSGNSNWYKILYSVLLSLYGPSSSVCVLIYP